MSRSTRNPLPLAVWTEIRESCRRRTPDRLRTELIHRLHGALAVAIPTDSSTLRITVSVGMATVTADTPDAEQVLQRADAAMYRAKRGAG